MYICIYCLCRQTARSRRRTRSRVCLIYMQGGSGLPGAGLGALFEPSWGAAPPPALARRGAPSRGEWRLPDADPKPLDTGTPPCPPPQTQRRAPVSCCHGPTYAAPVQGWRCQARIWCQTPPLRRAEPTRVIPSGTTGGTVRSRRRSPYARVRRLAGRTRELYIATRIVNGGRRVADAHRCARHGARLGWRNALCLSAAS